MGKVYLVKIRIGKGSLYLLSTFAVFRFKKMISEVTKKGIEAQLKAELRANELGYIVSKPTTECCRYDMIIDDGTSLKRLQVKYCNTPQTSADGSVCINLRKVTNSKKIAPCYTEREIDGLVVYLKPVDKLCYFPADFISGKSTITIRYEKAKNQQAKKIVNYLDYLW